MAPTTTIAKRARPGRRAFTIIELLVVIAIIAILAALLFPVLAQVQESARAGNCMSQLHQIWVSANVYKQDEGAFPPVLYGYAEAWNCNTGMSSGAPLLDPTSQPITGGDQILSGALFPEQIKDSNLFLCSDDRGSKRRVSADAQCSPPPLDWPQVVTIAHWAPRPANWPANRSYITDNGTPVAQTCKQDNFGYQDCWLTGANKGRAKWYYAWDSYDIGPRVDAIGETIVDPSTGRPVFDVHYSLDWTGVTGATDLPDQLKYANPPPDKTLLTYCSWHTATAHAPTYTSITESGQAKKLDRDLFNKFGPNLYNR